MTHQSELPKILLEKFLKFYIELYIDQKNSGLHRFLGPQCHQRGRGARGGSLPLPLQNTSPANQPQHPPQGG